MNFRQINWRALPRKASALTDSHSQSHSTEESCIARLLDQAVGLQQVSDTPELDAQLLLAEVLGCSRAVMVAYPERVVDDQARQRFMVLLQRRQQGEPLAYILGRKAFWDFEVSVDAIATRASFISSRIVRVQRSSRSLRSLCTPASRRSRIGSTIE